MTVKDKEIKRIRMITTTLSKDMFGPGTLFLFKKEFSFLKYNVEVDERNVVVSNHSDKLFGGWCHVDAHEPLLFIDVVYDPRLKHHLLRFLYCNQVVAIVFTKGETIKLLRTKTISNIHLNKSDD